MSGKLSDTKARIISSSIDLFSQKGYTETSVKEIATASGIQVGSIYNYYSSKSEILDYILEMYIEHSRKNSLTRELIDEQVETEEPEAILRGMFYRYPEEDAHLYTKILKIILHEQYRNETVGDFMRSHFIQDVERDIDYCLVKLIEKGRIKPVNHRYYAKILNDLCLASTIQYGHFSQKKEYYTEERILMDDVIGFIIDKILADGAGSGDCLDERRVWLRNSQ